MEETLAYQQEKELRKKALDKFDPAKLKDWSHTRNVKGLQLF